jgi:SulP family sulfate permease
MSQTNPRFRLDRMEAAGALGDLGTLIPLVAGMILINGLEAANVVILFGVAYLAAGAYFGVPTPVQPMKVIAATSIALGLTPPQIAASCMWMGALLLVLGTTGLIEVIHRYTPRSVIRGVQLAVGVVLLGKGLELILAPDPQLALTTVGPVSTSLLLGAIGAAIALGLGNNPRAPAAILIVILGIAVGVFLSKPLEPGALSLGFHLPRPLPHGWPQWEDVLWVLPVVVLPQLPMTIGNAIISITDLSHQYFPENARRVTVRAITISQSLANTASFLMGGIPMCHGAGGLAAHYHFGARTAGTNAIIGLALVLMAVLLGESIVAVLGLLPLAILGVLLALAGLELALMIQDLESRADYFVALAMLGLGLTVNLGVAFLVGITLAYLSKRRSLEI